MGILLNLLPQFVFLLSQFRIILQNSDPHQYFLCTDEIIGLMAPDMIQATIVNQAISVSPQWSIIQYNPENNKIWATLPRPYNSGNKPFPICYVT